MDSVIKEMIDSRQAIPGRREKRRFTDIHCHCLPGLDDGPASFAEALDLCRMLARDGVSVVVATPHQLGRYHGRNEAARVREVVYRLNEAVTDSGIPIRIVAGGEVRVDERICQLLAEDRILTLADNGRYILIELPHEVFIDVDPLLLELVSTGIQPIISHAERITALARQPEILSRWLDHGACLQITASSLLGKLGPVVREFAWDCLSSGSASFVATDAHNTNSRRPQLRNTFELIRATLGSELAQRVCIDNPARTVSGQAILPVFPLQRQGVG